MTSPPPASSTASSESSGIDSELAALVDDFTNLLQRGEAPSIAEFAAEHPNYAADLRRLLPAVQAMATLGSNHSEHAPFDARRALPEAPFDTLLGEIGDFRIVRELGRGGMGIVYEAEQMSMRRRVALKVLPFAAVLDPRQLQRFRNEALAAAQLKHPHIVSVYGVGCERGIHHYAMEYIEGRTLAEVIATLDRVGREHRSDAHRKGKSERLESGDTTAKRTMPGIPGSNFAKTRTTYLTLSSDHARNRTAYCRSVAQIAMQVAQALDHAHEHGILHRDIKPSNLMLDERGTVYVTDFGLARIETDATLTVTGDVLGTLRYMCPEQALGKRVAVDQRADVYSLGATLYELLTLRPPFSGTDRQKLLQQIAGEEPPKPRLLSPQIPADLETIVLKAIEKNYADRYETARDFADDLERFLSNHPVKARRPTLSQQLAKWARRHSGVVWSALAILLASTLALSISTLWVLGERDRAQDAEGRARDAALNAEKQAVQAKANAQRAEAGLQIALEGFDKSVRTVVDQRWIPQLRGTHRQLIEESLALLNRLIELKPGDAHSHVLRGDIHQALRRPDDAVADYQKAIELDPKHHVAHFKLGSFYLTYQDVRKRDFKKSIQHTQRAVELAPQLQAYRIELALISTMSRLPQAPALFDEAILMNPQNSVAFSARADMRSERGQFASGLVDALKARELDPQNYEAHRALGRALNGLGRSEEALDAYTAAGNLAPFQHYVHRDRGECLKAMGRLPEAIEEFRAGWQLAPDHYTYPLRLAEVHFALSNYGAALENIAAAIELYSDNLSNISVIPPADVAACPDESFRKGVRAVADRALELAPENAQRHVNHAGLAWALGDVEAAITDLKSAIAIDPDDYVTRHLHSLCCLTCQNEIDYRFDCSELLRRCTKSESADALRLAAWTCCLIPNAADDVQPVVELARRAVKLRGEDDLQSVQTLGAALIRAGQIAEGLRILERAAALSNNEPWVTAGAQYFLALAYLGLDRTDEARHCYERAVAQSAQLAQQANRQAWKINWQRRLSLDLLQAECAARLGPRSLIPSLPDD